MADTDTSAARIARGAGWIYACRWTERLVSFASIAILARILDEEDFGLVAVAAGFVTVVEGLSEFDVKSALIQARSDDRPLFDSALSIAFLRGLLAVPVLAAAAWWLADADVRPVLFVLALVPLVDGLTNPRFVRFERDLDYSRVAIQTLTATAVTFAATVGIALIYRSHWALVAGMVAGSLARTTLSYALSPYRPRLSFGRAREILSFSGWMTGANAVATLGMRTDRLVVGGLLGNADAGTYYMAQRVGTLPTNELISPLQRILFPSFAQILDQPERLRRAVAESANILGSLSLAAAIGFALAANDFVPLALGDKWAHIVPLLLWLVPFLGLRASLSGARSVVLALGRTELMFRVSWIYALIHLPAFVLGTALFGVQGAVWAIAAAGVFYIGLNAWLMHTTVGVGPAEILHQLRRPLVAATVMVAGVLSLDRATGLSLFSTEGSVLSLTVKVAVGGGLFAGCQWLQWRWQGCPDGIERRLGRLLRGRG